MPLRYITGVDLAVGLTCNASAKSFKIPLHLMLVNIRPVGRIFRIMQLGLLQAKSQKMQMFSLSARKNRGSKEVCHTKTWKAQKIWKMRTAKKRTMQKISHDWPCDDWP